MRKAYSYIRMSNETQLRGDSLRRQLELSKNYARDNGLELVDSIDGVRLEDIGVSAFKGKNTQKGVLGVFLEALENRKIEPNSVLLVESLDRLSRDKMLGALSQFTTIVNHGVEIVTLTDNQRYTKEILNQNPAAIFISIGVMFRANDESEMKSKRLKAAWSNKRANAADKPMTRTCPGWLCYNDETKKLEPIPDRVQVVRQIFDLCINTCGLHGIAKHLNQNNVPLFGSSKLWYRSYIKKILSNRSVLGEFQPHAFIDGKRQPTGDVVPDYFPQIIDEQTFLLANAALSRRNVTGKGRKGASFSNLFTGFVYCGLCGNKMAVRNRGTKNRYKTLTCVISREGGSCKMPEWEITDLETKIFQHLREIDFDTILSNDKSNLAQLTQQVEILKEKLRLKEQEASRATDLAISDDLSTEGKARLVAKLNQIDAEIGQIKTNIAALSQEVADEKASHDGVKSSELQEMLRLIQMKNDDYFFRASVNQLLARFISKITLKVDPTEFQPWDIEEDDTVVTKFRQQNADMREISLTDLVKRRDFQEFAKQFQRTITINYVSGEVRHILGGFNFSFKTQPVRANPT